MENSKRLRRNGADKIWGKNSVFFTQKYLKYVSHEYKVKKTQVHTLTDLCSKFRGKTASCLRDMARTNSRMKKKKDRKKKKNNDKNNSLPL